MKTKTWRRTLFTKRGNEELDQREHAKYKVLYRSIRPMGSRGSARKLRRKEIGKIRNLPGGSDE